MDTLPKLLGFLLMLWITGTAKALPDPSSLNELTGSKNIVGISSQIITNALIAGQADSTTNYVFSPIGYATILSIISHGSQGRTRDEIFKVLEQPEDVNEVRNAYRLALSEYSGNDSMIAPQFKTWFYIYKNNSAEEEFKRILTDDYLVEIKDIERYDSAFDSFTTEDKTADDKAQSSKEDLLPLEDFKTDTSKIEDLETITAINGTPIPFEDTTIFDDVLIEGEIIDKDKNSKFDRHVEDSQYVEVPEIRKKIKDELLEAEHLNEKIRKQSSGPEKITLPLKKYMEDSMEIMEATENRNFVSRYGRAQPLRLDGDVTSALSGNSIVGKKSGDASEAGSALESKMLLFNGLYFRGEWAQPFMELRSNDIKYFNSMAGKQDVKFMMTNGLFKYAKIPSKQLVAVELPYKNERYSLLIVMPDSNQSLRDLSKDSTQNSLHEITSQMELTDLQLFVPKFRFECTSRAEKALGKLGLTTLFTSKADLRKITKNAENYQIEELVQHVAIRVDEGSSTENALSAGNVDGRNNLRSSELSVDKPFLFYVRDVVDEIILAAGKIVEVPVEVEIPISFN